MLFRADKLIVLIEFAVVVVAFKVLLFGWLTALWLSSGIKSKELSELRVEERIVVSAILSRGFKSRVWRRLTVVTGATSLLSSQTRDVVLREWSRVSD